MNQEQHSPLLTETAMRQTVRSTLHTATRPANGRLSQLTPPAPQHKKRGVWMRHLAPVALLLIILLGGFGMQQWNNETNEWNNPVPTHQLSTATMTNIPTATAAIETVSPTATRPPIAFTPHPSSINN